MPSTPSTRERKACRMFVKRGTPETASLEGEAAALRWLAQAEPSGGMPVVKVVSVNSRELVEERVASGAPSSAAAERVGAALAITHAAGAPWWGSPPEGWQGAYLIDASVTPTVPESEAAVSWGAFFARWRIMPYLRQAIDAGAITPDEAAVFERLATRLEDGVYDAAQPALLSVANKPVARIHGDLWSGNLMWDSNPENSVGAVLIDPMAHGGHAETDLAMLALFGCPYLDRIVSAYNEASPLADGWQDRVRLHQLAPLLHHCALFGRSYVRGSLEAARAYV